MRYLVDVGLAARGLALGDLETLFIPDAPELEALARGSIDAALVGDPWLTRALHERSAELWFPLDPMFSGESFGMVFFGPTLLDRDPDAGHRFLVAYLQGVRRFLEGKTERNLDILGEATAERRDILEGTCWPVMDPNGRLDPLGMRRYLEWTARQGLIDRAPTPAEFWDGRMIDRANEVLASSRSATHEPWAR